MDKFSPEKAARKIRQLKEHIALLNDQCREKVKTSLAKYRRVIEATSEGFLELDLDHKIIDYNATITELLGTSGEELIGRPIGTLYDRPSVNVHFASRDHLSFEAVSHSSSGEEFLLLFKRSILRDEEGKPNGYLIFITELTELREAQENLKAIETGYKNIFINAVQGMYQCSLEGQLFGVNPAFARIFGYEDPDDIIGDVSDITVFYKEAESRDRLITELKRSGSVTNYEVEMHDRDGKEIWAMINATLTTDIDGSPLIEGILVDNTTKRMAYDQLRKSRERFRYLANHDGLTGLFNTRYLYKSLERLIEESNENGESLSLIFLDMDNFKHVVDTYGHLHGSQALKEVAETLKENLEEPAYGVAYGGDEFVLVLPDTDRDAALELAEKIREMIQKTPYLTKRGLELYMSASFGVATYLNDAGSSREILALADEAMFHVKSTGKGAVATSEDVEK